MTLWFECRRLHSKIRKVEMVEDFYSKPHDPVGFEVRCQKKRTKRGENFERFTNQLPVTKRSSLEQKIKVWERALRVVGAPSTLERNSQGLQRNSQGRDPSALESNSHGRDPAIFESKSKGKEPSTMSGQAVRSQLGQRVISSWLRRQGDKRQSLRRR